VLLLNASGCLDALTAPDVANTLDVFVTKTITPLPRGGNEPVRIAETDVGMLNAIGLANPGREEFVATTLPRLRSLLRVPIWVSVGGFSAHDYADTCAALSGVGAIELNLSCPNVDEAPESAAEIVAASRAATPLPLYAKLSAASPDVAAVAEAVESAGADGLSLINTLPGMALDPATGKAWLGAGRGGQSGPAVRAVAMNQVAEVARATELPIVGMGGVASGRDAADLIAAGATCVAVGTESFRDPAAGIRIRTELVAVLESDGPHRPVLATPTGDLRRD
jgi:dihydroorotate dehydrogenase (NAD+) catalytic subunit